MSSGPKKMLWEVSLIRPFVITLLVLYHCLCLYTGGWTPPDAVVPNNGYWWLGHLISGFRIETIAFVGGYVFSYQCLELGRRLNFLPFVWKKFKRLIIPCLLFGILYYLLFRCRHPFSWYHFAWKVANGIGHLWFLPMLFWCFLLSWLADRLLTLCRHPKRVGFILLGFIAILTLVKVPSLRFGLTRVPHFLFYFWGGYMVRYHCRYFGDSRWRKALVSSVALGVLYLIFLLCHLRLTSPRMLGLGPIVVGPALYGHTAPLVRLAALLRTTCGILSLYALTQWLLAHPSFHRKVACSGAVRTASTLCYGVYVAHCYLLMALYYHSPFPQWLGGSWMLPWVAFLLVLPASMAITQLLLKTKFGRFLIG